MTYTIDEYLQTIPLQRGDRVHLALIPVSADHSSVPNSTKHQLSQYEISLSLIINDQDQYSLPLADVLKTSLPHTGYGNAEEKVSTLSKILCDSGFSRGAILTPFFEPSPLGLERGMSSNSAVYILSGLIEYTNRIAQKIDHTNHLQNITLANHTLDPETLDLLLEGIKGIFRGYHARTVEDHKLFLESQGYVPAPL